MSGGDVGGAPDADRSEHLAALHSGWATPPELVAAVVREVERAPVVDLRRVVAGEQNEVYDVTFDGGTPALIVKIAHRRQEAHAREAWVLRQCERRGIGAPRLHARRHIEVGGERRSLLVLSRLPGERLCDVDPDGLDVRSVLRELGAWLAELHAIPVRGFGYLDGAGVGLHATLEDWLAHVVEAGPAFEDAARSVGLGASTVRSWVDELVESVRAAPPRMALLHNDLQSNHVLVHDGRLSGVIDFGEVAAEPAAGELAKWDFSEGERFPVEALSAGYGGPVSSEAADDRVFRALWRATGLWRMAWYHATGFPAGVAAARDRLEQGPGR